MTDFKFTGMATVYDTWCEDGRRIKKGAFDHQDGETVPLVWRHGNKDITNVVGHGRLSVSEEPPGMRIFGTFNGTKQGRQAEQLVDGEDVTGLSIWANEIIEHALESGQLQIEVGGTKREVETGWIREVSLVLAGANPGAKIDDVIRHSDDPTNPDMVFMDGIIVHTGLPISLGEVEDDTDEVVEHEDETIEDVIATLDDDQRDLFDIIIHATVSGEKPPSGMAGDDTGGLTVAEVHDTLSVKQQNVLNYLVGKVSQDQTAIAQEADGDEGDPEVMTTNIFEQQNDNTDVVLSHESVGNVLVAAREGRVDSLRKLFVENEIIVSHSITDIDYLFPDAKNVKSGGPEFYTRPMEWVEGVLNGTQRRPFSRIKSWYSDLTPDAARAKGYVTGALKVEEVIAVLKRVTTPQTVYKLQKLDRDDILDITDFDVVMWLKSEMRLMLREELARAILFSDGRANTGADAIQTANIRPIYNDDPVYTIQWSYNDVGNLTALADMTNDELIDLIDFIAESAAEYRGAGSPKFYCAPAVRTKLMGIRDADGRRLHRSEAELADAMDVAGIVTVPTAAGMTSSDVEDPSGLPAGTYDLEHLGVIINLRDYVIGMDRGGQTSFFDDFDLNYNKYEYLYETRLSGALIHPKSAIAVNVATAFTAP